MEQCEYLIQCVEGPTCSAYMGEGRAFECNRTYQDVHNMEYRCDCQYTQGYKNWLKSQSSKNGPLSQEPVVLSDKVRQRFIKDYNLPIQLFVDDYFGYFCNLYDDQFNISSNLERLYKAIRSSPVALKQLDSSNEQGDPNSAFLEVYYALRDRILCDIKSLPAYETYNCIDMNKFSIGKVPYTGKDIYNQSNVGKVFISLDMSKANYQVLRKFDPSFVFDTNSYQDMLMKYATTDELRDVISYMCNSKYLRQVIFGNLNPKRQVTMQKYWMHKLLGLIDMGDDGECQILSVASFSNDEIVLEPVEKGHVLNSIKGYINALINSFESTYGIKISAEYFKLASIFDKYYVKRDLDDADKVTFKCVPNKFFAQVFKKYFGLPINDTDLRFLDDGYVAQYLKQIV